MIQQTAPLKRWSQAMLIDIFWRFPLLKECQENRGWNIPYAKKLLIHHSPFFSYLSPIF